MIFSREISQIIKKDGNISNIIPLAEKATAAFGKTRELNHLDCYGYLSEIQIRIQVYDYASRLKIDIFNTPWVSSCIDEIEYLLDIIPAQPLSEQSSQILVQCQSESQRLIGNLSNSLQILDNFLTLNPANGSICRRQIAWVLLLKTNRRWWMLTPSHARRIYSLMEDNLLEEKNSRKNWNLWFLACRMLTPSIPLLIVIDKVYQWEFNTKDLKAIFYHYVLCVIALLEGSESLLLPAQNAIARCRKIAEFLPDRAKSKEWLGLDQGIRAIVSEQQMGKWDNTKVFWEDSTVHKLKRVSGIITRINSPSSGFIEFCGFEVFFVPGKSKHIKGSDENKQVSFYLGFSYDGLRAWEVADK